MNGINKVYRIFEFSMDLDKKCAYVVESFTVSQVGKNMFVDVYNTRNDVQSRNHHAKPPKDCYQITMISFILFVFKKGSFSSYMKSLTLWRYFDIVFQLVDILRVTLLPCRSVCHGQLNGI